VYSWWSIDRCTSNHSLTQLWHLVCTAQRHQGGGRRPGDSRGAVHAKRQSEHRTGVGLHVSKREKIARSFNNTDMEI
jgi:hypothetical protein